VKQNPRFASKDDGIWRYVFCYAKKREAAEMSRNYGGLFWQKRDTEQNTAMTL
jgi:hypothetical protein